MFLVFDKLSIEKYWKWFYYLTKNAYCKILKMVDDEPNAEDWGCMCREPAPTIPEFLNLRFHSLSPAENRSLKSKWKCDEFPTVPNNVKIPNEHHGWKRIWRCEMTMIERAIYAIIYTNWIGKLSYYLTAQMVKAKWNQFTKLKTKFAGKHSQTSTHVVINNFICWMSTHLRSADALKLTQAAQKRGTRIKSCVTRMGHWPWGRWHPCRRAQAASGPHAPSPSPGWPPLPPWYIYSFS